MNPFFKDLGVGVGLRPTHYSNFSNQKPKSVSWIEVISENFMPWEDDEFKVPLQQLLKVRREVPVALHGVSLNIGSSDEINKNYLKRLKTLTQMVEPAIISDHLCWTGIGNKNLHDLIPIPYTSQAIELLAQKIDTVQNYLGRRILLENVSSYLEFQQSEMSEWEFIANLLQKADCGILLDINNVYVSSVNHGFDPIEYLKAIPRQRVGQIHLAGHSKQNNFLIDTHDTPVCPEVWELYRWSIPHFGLISSMIERDDHIPEWEELEKELLTIADIRRLEKTSGTQNSSSISSLAASFSQDATPAHNLKYHEIQIQLQDAIQKKDSVTDLPDLICNKHPISRFQRLKIYQDGYFMRLRDAFKEDFKRVFAHMGPKQFGAVVEEFLKVTSSRYTSIDEFSKDFFLFLDSKPEEISTLASHDWLELLASWAPFPDPAVVLSAEEIQTGTPFRLRTYPSSFLGGTPRRNLLAYRLAGEVYIQSVASQQTELISFLKSSKTLEEVFEKAQGLEISETELQKLFIDWTKNEIVYCERLPLD